MPNRTLWITQRSKDQNRFRSLRLQVQRTSTIDVRGSQILLSLDLFRPTTLSLAERWRSWQYF
jgi:hypothetical protein